MYRTLQNLILNKLFDEKITFYLDDQEFTKRILNHPEAAVILIQIIKTEEADLATRAANMLSFFGEPGLKVLFDSIISGSSTWNAYLLSIASMMVKNMKHWEVSKILHQPEIIENIVKLLRDVTWIPLPDQERQLVEIDYEYRICDETYIFIIYMLDPSFDEGLFQQMSVDKRDREIVRLLHTIQIPPVA